MIKSKALEFHETFLPETAYIAAILKLASENFSGTKFEISEKTGIPTGKQKGKVEPHIKYAKFMGLTDYTFENSVYSLFLTPLGQVVFAEDHYLHEALSCLICHYGMTRRESGAPQWEFLMHNAYPGLGVELSEERLFTLAGVWCDIPKESMTKKVFSVVKGSYMKGCFEKLNFLTWKKHIVFHEQSERPELIFVYAYALYDSWDRLLPNKREIIVTDMKNVIGFDRIFGFNEDELNSVIDALAFEGILTVNRQLFPATLIRIYDKESILSKLYSRLL